MPKPKGMWWRTYYRLQRRAQAAEDRAADDFIIAAGRLVKVGASKHHHQRLASKWKFIQPSYKPVAKEKHHAR